MFAPFIENGGAVMENVPKKPQTFCYTILMATGQPFEDLKFTSAITHQTVKGIIFVLTCTK
jgi:hypothetical protein